MTTQRDRSYKRKEGSGKKDTAKCSEPPYSSAIVTGVIDNGAIVY